MRKTIYIYIYYLLLMIHVATKLFAKHIGKSGNVCNKFWLFDVLML